MIDFQALDLIEGIANVKGWSILLSRDEEKEMQNIRSVHAHLLHLTDDS
jgi:hypothetical protein